MATDQQRVRHQAFLNHLLAERIAEQPRDALLDALAAHRVPAGAIHDLPTVFEQPAAQAMVVQDEEGAQVGVRHVAFRVEGEAPAPLAPPPRYAAHTRDVLAERLGYSADELERLLRTGVIV